MSPFGVIECFYGHAWPDQDRELYASFLKEIGFQFYIYGPKGDARLRKHWSQPFSAADVAAFQGLRDKFTQQGLRFGMALSPQGLHQKWDLTSRRKLQDKVNALDDLGLDLLGLFFDDMKSAPDMAQYQLEIVQCVESCTKAKIVFCPSYYSFDSLLDIMFGDRPHLYLEALGQGLSPNIEVLWTGEEIISQQISAAHLRQVRDLLRRKPFICDNFFANDGPLNCNLLRVQPLLGRQPDVFAEATAWAFNPMNQAHLSMLVLKSAAAALLHGQSPEQAFQNTLRALPPGPAAEFLTANHPRFCYDGLDSVSNEDKAGWKQSLARGAGPLERELIQWLDGHYTIAIEALLNQSCYD